MKALRVAVAMFTIAPVPRSWHADAVAHARGTLRWLPFLGAALGGLAGLAATGAVERTDRAALLGAALSVALLALLTRGLHLDGLADTADALGSRAPATRALEIMKQSDVGPFGVVAIASVLLVDVAALTVLDAGHPWRAPAALAVTAATGRLAVVHAGMSAAPAARPDGFGALVTGSVAPVEGVLLSAAVLGGGAGLAVATGCSPAGWVLAQAGALVLAALFRVHCSRRFGGVTGDVFGSLVEVATATALVGIALS